MVIAVLGWARRLPGAKRQQLSPLVDLEKVSHYSYICDSAGAELTRKGRRRTPRTG